MSADGALAADTRPVVSLQPDRQRRVLGGHPWVYSNEVAMTPAAKALPPGTLVALAAASGERLGTAMFNPHPLVSARLLSRDPAARIDAAFLAERLVRARDLRDRLIGSPFYRLIHAEADGLPGLVVDRYGDVAVLQLNTAGIDALKAPLLDAVAQALAPRAVVLRNDSSARETEGLATGVEVAAGSLDQPVELIENGARFRIDPLAGQKTGWFHDQRDNRAAIARLGSGARVLDLYAYGGGFGITALVAGAASAHLVDRSKPALEACQASAALNGVAERLTVTAGDGFEVMEKLLDAGERYDIVVADPPAFVKSRKDLAVGLKAYRRMARLAAGLVRPQGFLFVASCSHNVEPDAFAAEVRAGLSRARRSGRILRSAGAAPDHPVHPFLPESAYLKGQLLQLD